MSYFSSQLKKRRNGLGLTMQQLADRANVCKSMICKMERNDTQPTIDVAARVAKALDVTLTEMLHPPQKARAHLITQQEQSTWEDAQHIQRRTLSPVFEGLKLDWLQVTVPNQVTLCNTEIEQSGSFNKVEKYIVLAQGQLEITISDQAYHLKQGDSFYFDARAPHKIYNPDKKEPAQFYLVINYI